MDGDLRPAKIGGTGDKKYFTHTCKECGKEATNSYYEPIGSRMLAARRCFLCDYWDDFVVKRAPNAKHMTIIASHVYGPGDRTTGSFRGMAGRRFDIEYIEPSEFAGRKITTFDLWSGSTIPEQHRHLFPDTARFLGGAAEAEVGDITCWNPSDGKSEPHPLPHTLKGLDRD